MLDLILKNGLVCDPANSIQSILNVGIRNGRIACLTSESFPATAEIDCAGHIVSPGFVDAHSHEDDLRAGHIEADITLRALRQGVTTLVAGNCGDAPSDLPAYCAAYDGKQPVNMALPGIRQFAGFAAREISMLPWTKRPLPPCAKHWNGS